MNYKKNVVISFLFYAATIFVNSLSGAGLINGNSQTDVSRAYPSGITPAPYAFSIWGVIYLTLLIAIFIPLIKKKDIDIKNINAVAVMFWLSCIFNIGWTFVFSYEVIWLSAIFIVGILIFVFASMLKLKAMSGNKNGIFDLAFGLYGGWLSIASVVNFVAFLVSIKFDFFGNKELFYSIVLAAFILLIALIQKVHNNPFYVFSIIWAFIGILVRYSNEIFTTPKLIVVLIGIVALLLVDYFVTIRKMDKMS